MKKSFVMARILIVEDDPNTLSGLVEILNQEGYHVKGVDCPRRALEILNTDTFDVLLTDLRMPGMSGFELFRKTRPDSVSMRTIIMTAYDSVSDEVEAVMTGVYRYLTKPLDVDNLLSVLEGAIDELRFTHDKRNGQGTAKAFSSEIRSHVPR